MTELRLRLSPSINTPCNRTHLLLLQLILHLLIKSRSILLLTIFPYPSPSIVHFQYQKNGYFFVSLIIHTNQFANYFQQFSIYSLSLMSNRKIWTDKQDEVLKHLIEEEKLTKWAEIAQRMNSQYQFICNQRQCRSRYIYKLAKNVNSSPLTPQEENLLFDFQTQYGNKWALIASKLGRIDNYVKNYFYAKLRRCIRKANKFIAKYITKEFHKIETAALYKLIQSLENSQDCRKIKEKLRKIEDGLFDSKDTQGKIQFVRDIVQSWSILQPQLKRSEQMHEQGTMLMENALMEVQSESYHSSKSSHHHTINSYNSSSHSNSHSNSNNSDRPLHNIPVFVNSKQNLLTKPLQIKRSHSIQQSDGQANIEEQQSCLYKSSNLDNRSKKQLPKPPETTSQNYLTSSVNMLEQIQQIQIIKINFISPRVSSQSSSKKSDRIAIQIDQQQMQNIVARDSPPRIQQNLWEAMLIPDLTRDKNPFDC